MQKSLLPPNKNSYSFRLIWLKACLILVIVLGLITLPKKAVFSAVIDKIVVLVNDEVITQREVAQLLFPLYEEYKKEYTGKRLERKMLEAENEVINQLIDDKLILSEAKSQGIEATDKEIEPKLAKVKEQFETEENFREALARQNVTLSELRDRIASDVMKQKLIRKVLGSKITITPIEVRHYYDEHISDYKEAAKVNVFNILIKTGKDGRTKEEAGFILEKIRESILSGKDFEELAREYSEGPNAKEGGGLGIIEKGQMIKEIDEVIFSLDVGAVSENVESPLGYHIFKISEKTPEKMKGFEDVKNDIEETIYKERVDKNLKKWLKEVRKNAYISVK